jgi:hypothetical protein
MTARGGKDFCGTMDKDEEEPMEKFEPVIVSFCCNY